MSRIDRAPLAALVLLAASLSCAGEEAQRGSFGESVRGITISTHLDGRDWAWDGIGPTVEALHALGADWIAIHPYAAIGEDGSVRFAALDGETPPESLARPIREAHARGMKILIKPHLAYWGTRFSWRGEIDFEDPAAWARFWTDYERWIVAVARATREADGFVLGTELVHASGDEQRWRDLARAVREVTHVPLTYAANWDEYEQIGFWDALDAIGIQAYFPLVADGIRDEASIRAGWQRWSDRLREFSQTRGRPVLFTELGYNHSLTAPARPWEYDTDGEAAREVQAICLRAALDAIEAEPALIGAFLWKWFPEPRPLGRNFQLATPPIMAVIRAAWSNPTRRSAAPTDVTAP